MTNKVRIGIVGGAGYTAGEMLRILLNHPFSDISWVHSQSHAGQPIYQVHTDLLGDTDLHFASEMDWNVDLVFLCVSHGQAKAFVEAANLPPTLKIVDLSQDFRLGDEFVYGLPELNRDRIRGASRIANPGCFATALQLALLPIAAIGELRTEIHIHAITGSTGAGQKPEPTTHFSWRHSNISVYKAFEHQHLAEIGRSLHQLQGDVVPTINFIPVRGGFTRGIYASVYFDTDLPLSRARELFSDFYADHPFTHLANMLPDMKQVVNTNKAILHLEKHGDKLLITSMIDNLLKGASGQAVQNMNLMLGYDEREGLRLKGIGF